MVVTLTSTLYPVKSHPCKNEKKMVFQVVMKEKVCGRYLNFSLIRSKKSSLQKACYDLALTPLLTSLQAASHYIPTTNNVQRRKKCVDT